MSLALNLALVPFSCRRFESRKEIFRANSISRSSLTVHKSPTIAAKRSCVTVKCSLNTPTDLMGNIGEKLKGRVENSLAAAYTDIPANLCIIDTVQRLGIDRYFQSQINTVLEETNRLWQWKDKRIFSDITTHAMAFRLLRVHGYQVSSEELSPYADEEMVRVGGIDVGVVMELYRAAQERIYEEETTLQKLLAWTTSYLNHQLLTNSISDKKLHKLVEYYLKNYHGIMDRVGVRRCLDLYDIGYYQALKAADRFPSLSNEDFLAFARQDFNICQAQHRKELEQLQRWYADCRLDRLKSGRDAVRAANFMSSGIIGDPEYSEFRLAFAKQVVLVARIDDFFDHVGPREESYKILELVKDWEEKTRAEYGSEEVEILFTALYKTVNELAEMAHVQQGRSVKHLLIQLWVEILSVFKLELETWNTTNEEEAVSLDEYLCSSWVSVGCRVCILTSMQFLGIKLSEEMVESEECTDLCRHVSMVDRLLNDVGSFKRERNQNTVNSVSILIEKDGGGVSEEEAVAMLKKMAENNRRKLMQLVYKKGSIFPRKCKDSFHKVCRIGCYLYWSGDELTSPRQMMEDMKSLVYEPLILEE